MLAERDTLPRMCDRIFHRSLRHAYRRGANEHASEFEQPEKLLKASLVTAQTILRQKLNIVERERSERQHGLPYLVDRISTYPFERARDEPKRERRILAWVLHVLINRGNQDVGRILAVVHIVLLAIENDLAIDGLRAGMHAHRIRTCNGLGNGEREHETPCLTIEVERIGKT